MNPCKQHEKVDVDEHGTGFDCVYCKVAKLEAEIDYRDRLIERQSAQLAKLEARVDELEADAAADAKARNFHAETAALNGEQGESDGTEMPGM